FQFAVLKERGPSVLQSEEGNQESKCPNQMLHPDQLNLCVALRQHHQKLQASAEESQRESSKYKPWRSSEQEVHNRLQTTTGTIAWTLSQPLLTIKAGLASSAMTVQVGGTLFFLPRG
ncbi:hypothetical protein ILYODFUR_032037, partial [Ilyodon furcidens]